MTFAEKLRDLRDRAGLSEAALAKKSGVPFGTIHFYGLGRRKPTFNSVVRVAAALGVSCEAFADCDDVRSEDPETEPPESKRGRPAKPKEDPQKAKPKRPRGRPKGN